MCFCVLFWVHFKLADAICVSSALHKLLQGKKVDMYVNLCTHLFFTPAWYISGWWRRYSRYSSPYWTWYSSCCFWWLSLPYLVSMTCSLAVGKLVDWDIDLQSVNCKINEGVDLCLSLSYNGSELHRIHRSQTYYHVSSKCLAWSLLC